MGLASKIARLGRRMWGRNQGAPLESRVDMWRACRVEQLEPRQLMAADIQFGAVYYDPHSGDGSAPNLFYISFLGGAAGTELSHLTISTAKNGVYEVDPAPTDDVGFFHTQSTAYEPTAGGPFTVVNANGITASNVQVVNDSTLLSMDFSNFTAGKTFVFSIKVDESAVPNNLVVEGAEFEGSQVTPTFTQPDYYDATGTGIYKDVYTFGATGLPLPGDTYTPPSDTNEQVYTAGAPLPLPQTPLPSSLSGIAYVDNANTGVYQLGDTLLTGVEVDLLDQDGNVVATQHTDAKGAYNFQNLLPGTYTVHDVDPSGYFPGGDNVGSLGGLNPDGNDLTAINLAPNQNGVQYNFYVIPPNSISGIVKLETFGDCETHPEDPPVAGVTIQLLNSTGTVVATTTTDANGEYSFSHLLPGQYSVRETVPNGLLAGDDHVGSQGGSLNGLTEIDGANLVGGVDGLQYNFCLIPPNSISGVVKVETTSDWETNPNDPVLSGVTIQLVNSAGVVVATQQTDKNGAYDFQMLMPDTYHVVETVPPNYFASDDHVGSLGGTANGLTELDAIAVLGGVNGVHYDFAVVPPDSISGVVKLEVFGDCETHPNDPGVEGVTIQLLDSTGTVINTTTTDVNGQYSFTQLYPGQYSVRETVPNGLLAGDDHVGSQGGALNGLTEIDDANLVGGVNGVEYNFCLIPPNSIAGVVKIETTPDWETNSSDPTVSGVTIQLVNSSGTVVATTQTNDQGQYKFQTLMPDTYEVRETVPTGYFASDDNVGSLGGTANGFTDLGSITLLGGVNGVHYDFAIVPPGSITGIVKVDMDGNCETNPNEPTLAGVTVDLLNAQGSVISTTVTDAHGVYTFTNLMPGSYGVEDIVPAGYMADDSHVGSVGGVIISNTLVTQIGLTEGANGTGYDFCVVPPGSISGVVHVDVDGNCETNPNEPTLAGVTVELLDSQGNVQATTVTNAKGQYTFSNLFMGTYEVEDIVPAGYLADDSHVGTDGGVIVSNTLVTQIGLNTGDNTTGYDFCVVQPATISGIVFQDGPTIQQQLGTTTVITAANSGRDGIYQSGDPLIAGVTLILADGNGNVMTDPVTGQPIETKTDANGFYSFSGLAPGSYTVYELPPSGYIVGLETAGSTGGVALNAGVAAPAGFVGNSATAIAAITVGNNQTSVSNNFSVLLVNQPFFIIPPNPGNPAIPNTIVTNPFAPPAPFTPQVLAPTATPVSFYSGGGGDGFTWHLSVVNAGQPRGDQVVSLTAQQRELNDSWETSRLTESEWVLTGEEGQQPRQFAFGMRDGTPVVGDFNGDGTTDVGVFKDGQWFIDLNGNGVWDKEDLWAKLGFRDDLPITGDWDGDGKADIGIYGKAWAGDPRAIAHEPGLPDPDNKNAGVRKNLAKRETAPHGWRTMQRTSTGRVRDDLIDHVFHYGTPGDQPIAGDWNGAGVDTIGIFRDGRWDLDVDGNGKWSTGDKNFQMGQHGDIPVVGDFDGDGRDDLGIYRAGTWHIDVNADRVLDQRDMVVKFGDAGDLPIVGDWNGDGREEMGVYRNGRLIPASTAQAPAADMPK